MNVLSLSISFQEVEAVYRLPNKGNSLRESRSDISAEHSRNEQLGLHKRELKIGERERSELNYPPAVVRENGDRRSGLDRRKFSYSDCIPERRMSEDRRSGFDRRSGLDRRKLADRRCGQDRRCRMPS
jgi:hypothetical protein